MSGQRASPPAAVSVRLTPNSVTWALTRCLARRTLVLACIACSSSSSGPDDSDPSVSLDLIAGTCAIQRFEIVTPVPPFPVEYDAAANGYRGTVTIRATSPTAGSWVLAATARDFLGVGEVGSGSLTIVQPDTLLFQGSRSLPGRTRFEVAGSLLTLVSTSPHSVTIPAGTIQSLTRIVCRT